MNMHKHKGRKVGPPQVALEVPLLGLAGLSLWNSSMTKKKPNLALTLYKQLRKKWGGERKKKKKRETSPPELDGNLAHKDSACPGHQGMKKRIHPGKAGCIPSR